MLHQTKTPLILPFEGEWFVSNGGKDPKTNSHIRPPDQGPQNQLYAYDFRFENTGQEKTLQDYQAYGKQVISPGTGIITQVIDGSIDVQVGERDRSVGVGNAIIIDHQNGEYSLLCHFKHRSINVKPGDNVNQGQELGLCGNTGNTTQPHIHFNLQDSPLMHKSKALPAAFTKINVDGEEKINYEPNGGQHVSNP